MSMEKKSASLTESSPAADVPVKNWCSFRLDSGKLSKRCFFKGVNEQKPAYIFGQQAGGSLKPHMNCEQASSQDDNSGQLALKALHPIVHQNVKVSPERYENTFEKLFRGSAELDGKGAVKEEEKKNTQHPSRVLENAQTKSRMLEAMGRVETTEEGATDAAAKAPLQRLLFSTDNNEPLHCNSRLRHRNMHESSYWSTAFRSQQVEQGTLVDTERYDFHKLKRQASNKLEEKPYNTNFPSDSPAQDVQKVLQKLKERSLQNGMSGYGWSIQRRGNEVPAETLHQEAQEENKEDHSVATKLLKDLEKARKLAEDEKKVKPFNEQGLKRSECSWFRHIKSIDMHKQDRDFEG